MSRHAQNGDGDVCPVNPDHGRMYRYPSWDGQWCPHQSHDVDRTPALYGMDGVTPRRSKDRPDAPSEEWNDLLDPTESPVDPATAKRLHRAELRRARKARKASGS